MIANVIRFSPTCTHMQTIRVDSGLSFDCLKHQPTFLFCKKCYCRTLETRDVNETHKTVRPRPRPVVKCIKNKMLVKHKVINVVEFTPINK